MEETYNIWLTIWWIWMLIYGMVLMEEVIRKMIKIKMQQKLEKYTKNKWNSFLLWIFWTWLTQSSSLTSLLLLVFVWAWIITLKSGIAVIIWANIGTTFTSLLVAVLWFGKFSISAFAFPLIGIAWTLLLFVKKKKRRYYLKLLLSFWLIFFGIDLIKDSVEMLKTVVDFSQYASFWILGFFVLWVIMTAIIQSSHTVVIMTLAALHGGIITFPMALWVVIGSNIGTTVTVLFASLWWSVEKKRVAFSHLWFNLILSIIWLLYYNQIQWVVEHRMGVKNPVLAIAIFNTVLNAITAWVVLPFLDQFVSTVERYSKKIESNAWLLHSARLSSNAQWIDPQSLTTIQLRALYLDIQKIWRDTADYILSLIDSSYDQQRHKQHYESLKTDIDSVLSSLLSLEREELTPEEQKKQQYLEKTVSACIETLKHGKSIWEDMDKLRDVASLKETSELGVYYSGWKEFIGPFMLEMKARFSDNHFDNAKDWEQWALHKDDWKEKYTLSKKFFDTSAITNVTTVIPLSTLFNIERQLNYIIKYSTKAWKWYLRVLELDSYESGYKSLTSEFND